MCEINTYVKMKAEKLAKKVEAGVSLCGYRSLRFDNGNLPDYNDDIVQDVYAIRYSMAYALEYKEMYKKLSQRMLVKDSLKVVSLGCGTMIDYWALKQVFNDTRINYQGIDVIDWRDKFAPCSNDTVEFTQQSICDYFNECSQLDADVYIFPKSISELDGEMLDNICRIFAAKGMMKDEIHIMFSLRASQNNLEQDLEKTNRFYNRMSALGLYSDDDSATIYRGEDKMIYFSDRDFNVYDLKEAYNLLENLANECKNYNRFNYTCKLCHETRNQPMLKCKYMKYQIFTFRKAA